MPRTADPLALSSLLQLYFQADTLQTRC